MRRYALRDDQWERIASLLLGREGGATAKDNRYLSRPCCIVIVRAFRGAICLSDLATP